MELILKTLRLHDSRPSSSATQTSPLFRQSTSHAYVPPVESSQVEMSTKWYKDFKHIFGKEDEPSCDDIPDGDPALGVSTVTSIPVTLEQCDEVGICKHGYGRDKTKLMRKIAVHKKRIRIRLTKGGDFKNREAITFISAAMRFWIDASFHQWSEVPATERRHMWYQFGMRFRWRKGRKRNIESDVLKRWNSRNKEQYSTMISQACSDENLGKRSKFLNAENYFRFKLYVKNTDHKFRSDTASDNRGHHITHTGGRKRSNPESLVDYIINHTSDRLPKLYISIEEL